MSFTKEILIHVPITKLFDFARLMKKNEFNWIEIYSSDTNTKEHFDNLLNENGN